MPVTVQNRRLGWKALVLLAFAAASSSVAPAGDGCENCCICNSPWKGYQDECCICGTGAHGGSACTEPACEQRTGALIILTKMLRLKEFPKHGNGCCDTGGCDSNSCDAAACDAASHSVFAGRKSSPKSGPAIEHDAIHAEHYLPGGMEPAPVHTGPLDHPVDHAHPAMPAVPQDVMPAPRAVPAPKKAAPQGAPIRKDLELPPDDKVNPFQDDTAKKPAATLRPLSKGSAPGGQPLSRVRQPLRDPDPTQVEPASGSLR